MSHEFKPGPATLKGGGEARIYETDGKPPRRIHGAYRDGSGEWDAAQWRQDGGFGSGTGEEGGWDGLDLVPPKRQMWMALFQSADGSHCWTHLSDTPIEDPCASDVVLLEVCGPIELEPEP